ncbi:MAG: hypothetical protein KatS3mg004_0290 [Bryobacteraceae bacterium]|nr:MAG: hypothetical protein KatS3mg004_0290 [Bryobacteraceae bacterium]
MPRSGSNPFRHVGLNGSAVWHRVVLPVFVPEDSGYFEQSAEVLDLCLSSLWATCGQETAITVVVNAASRKTFEVIERHRRSGHIDTLIAFRENAGKVNALMAGVRGSHEPIVTLTDSDIFFLPGWLEATVAVFNAFPMAGAVSALPVPHLRRQCTTATWLGAAVRGKLVREALASPSDLELYMRDLNSPALIRPDQRKRQWGVRNGCAVALIGATHMQCTFRREVFDAAPRERCGAAMGQDSEYCWMDLPADLLGMWRLSLCKAYVRHMGNRVPEELLAPEAGRSDRYLAAPKAPDWHWERAWPYRMRCICGRVVNRVCEGWLLRLRGE